jgi:hypothetical protein
MVFCYCEKRVVSQKALQISMKPYKRIIGSLYLFLYSIVGFKKKRKLIPRSNIPRIISGKLFARIPTPKIKAPPINRRGVLSIKALVLFFMSLL